MKHEKTITGIILLCLTLNTMAAELTGNMNPTADCFAPATETYTLQNTSGREHTYTLTAVGEQKQWINLEGKWIHEQPLTITLGANQSKQLFAFIKPQDCYVEPGTYAIGIEIENEGRITRTINLQVVPIRTLSLEASPGSAQITQCKSAVLDLNIENTGKSDELATLKVVDIPSEWASFSEKEFVLEQGRNRQAKLTITPNCTAETKAYNFSVQAELSGTSFFTKKNLSLAIKDSQKLEITAPVIVACNDAQTKSELLLKNSGLLDEQL